MLDNSRAAYRILSPNGFFGPDDHLYQEGEEIYFDGEPNEEMEALNELGQERLVQYLTKLDDLAREAAAKAGRVYVGRPRNLDGGLALATEVQRASMSIMGARKETAVVERVDAQDVPETGSINPKKARIGRPRKASPLSINAA